MIPETKLDTWASPAPTTMAADTYDSIRAALTSRELPLEIYLQGSYRNTTNVRGDSDVDVVAEYADLGPRTNLRSAAVDLRNWTIATLRQTYAHANVLPGAKSIKVLGVSGRLDADVVPTLGVTSNRYGDFRRPIEAIYFCDAHTGAEIVNFPKQHYANGVAKHQACANWYKPTVRMFKNARRAAEERGLLTAGLTPSYFLQCLLYNVPKDCFGQSLQITFCSAIEWLGRTDLRTFVCQNDCQYLFGRDHTQWNEAAARQFIRAMASLWQRW